jgi:uncharacterized damage-inducible protein DinB
MRAVDVRALFDHLYWVRDRILDATSTLAVEQFTAPDAPTIRDLRATLIHELDVQWSWRERLRGEDPTFWGTAAELRPEDYPDARAVREHWARDEAAMRVWLGGLTDAQLEAPQSGEGLHGLPLWVFLVHLTTHGMQQFADAATILHARGASAGGIEFLDYIEARGKRWPPSAA